MKALLLSNVNMQPLVRFLKPWDVTCGEYNSILKDLSVSGSLAPSSAFTHIFCFFDSDTMMGEAFYGRGQSQFSEAFLSALEAFCGKHSDKVVVTHTLSLTSSRWLGFADPIHPASLMAAETKFNRRIVAIAKTCSNLLIIDLSLLYRRFGEDALTSPSFWYAGRVRYTEHMFRVLGTRVQQALAGFANQNRKVIVLDLDNTLWGGIVGEVGPMGIALSEDNEGRCYRDFQRFLKAVQSTGVLLAICSKNNKAEVDEVFDNNPMMILGRSDFAAIRVDWQPKVSNIINIAETLNLGLDSFVFIDDSPVERSMVTTNLPEIAVPEFPHQIENLPSWFVRDVVPCFFPKYSITEEDVSKTKQYRANEKRRLVAKDLDFDTFISELQIECTFSINSIERAARVAQMTQKTNQFNLTTRRYEVPDIRRFIESPSHAVIVLDYQDRFGAEGSVGLAILDLEERRIDTFLLSCRVIGRKVEDILLDKALELCRAHGIRKVVGELLPTAKNQPCASFYDTHGFRLTTEFEDGRKLYERLII